LVYTTTSPHFERGDECLQEDLRKYASGMGTDAASRHLRSAAGRGHSPVRDISNFGNLHERLFVGTSNHGLDYEVPFRSLP